MRSHTARDYWDGNWVDSSIKIRAGGFSGSFGASLRAEEFKSFRDQLAKLYSLDTSNAEFTTMEEQLRIHVNGDRLGHYTAECSAIDRAGIGKRLSFELEFDQTDIPSILAGLDSIIESFPVVGSPSD
jgi:hypothetical protein